MEKTICVCLILEIEKLIWSDYIKEGEKLLCKSCYKQMQKIITVVYI